MSTFVLTESVQVPEGMIVGEIIVTTKDKEIICLYPTTMFCKQKFLHIVCPSGAYCIPIPNNIVSVEVKFE